MICIKLRVSRLKLNRQENQFQLTIKRIKLELKCELILFGIADIWNCCKYSTVCQLALIHSYNSAIWLAAICSRPLFSVQQRQTLRLHTVTNFWNIFRVWLLLSCFWTLSFYLDCKYIKCLYKNHLISLIVIRNVEHSLSLSIKHRLLRIAMLTQIYWFTNWINFHFLDCVSNWTHRISRLKWLKQSYYLFN